ncbi:MAG TPA: hypothetical protein PLL53_14010 [Saprospiraceae bacterium]|nr:hypothetical protein [Saprospiraceae bacterium]
MKCFYFVIPMMVFCNHISGQSFLKSTQIRPVIGARNHTDGWVGFRTSGPRYVISSVLLGVDISLDSLPISMAFHRDWSNEYFDVFTMRELGISQKQTWIENHLLFKYRMKKKNAIGIGYYHMKRENIAHHTFNSNRDNKGLLLSYSQKLDWLSIELRNKISLQPIFGFIVDDVLYSIVMTYTIHDPTNEKDENHKAKSKIAVNGLLGTRFFSTKGMTIIPNEDFDKIGISPTIGIEILDRKSNFSLNLEKDIWISLNGGSPFREVKGYLNSTFIGIKYHLALKNERHIRMGLGYSMIRDLDKTRYLVIPSPYNTDGLVNYQVKGIGVTASYELFKNTDIELKHTFPIRSLNEPLFNPTRFSAGIIYRAHPK